MNRIMGIRRIPVLIITQKPNRSQDSVVLIIGIRPILAKQIAGCKCRRCFAGSGSRSSAVEPGQSRDLLLGPK